MSMPDSRFHVLALAGLIFFSSCQKSESPILRQTTAMNTYVSISIYDRGVSDRIANPWIDSCISEIRRVEQMATDYNDSSEVGEINLHAGLDTMSVSPELAKLLRAGLDYGQMSEWRLDITIKPLVKEWDFLSTSPRVPPAETIKHLLPLVNAHRLFLDGNRVYLPQRGMGIDLGSYGKGYAIDQAVNILKNAGFHQFIVDIGGKLGVYWEGTHLLDSSAVEVLIRHPRKQGAYLGTFRVGSGAVSTSGDYERYFIQDGIRYHHLLDPFTGYPARGVVSVTLVADDPLFADALSTVVFLLGREKGMALMQKMFGVEGMITYESGDSLAFDLTPGFARCLRPAPSQ